MDNNELLMIILAFVLGYMCSGMMKNMCGRRLFEGTAIGQRTTTQRTTTQRTTPQPTTMRDTQRTTTQRTTTQRTTTQRTTPQPTTMRDTQRTTTQRTTPQPTTMRDTQRTIMRHTTQEPEHNQCQNAYISAIQSALSGDCSCSADQPISACQHKINTMLESCNGQKFNYTDDDTSQIIKRPFNQQAVEALQLMGAGNCEFNEGGGP
jgi:hypothetical protein